MDRGDLRAQLAGLDLSRRLEEVDARARMLALLDGTEGCFERTAFPGHFTGSALVVDADGGRVLLHAAGALRGGLIVAGVARNCFF